MKIGMAAGITGVYVTDYRGYVGMTRPPLGISPPQREGYSLRLHSLAVLHVEFSSKQHKAKT